jgi:hypothetical protein
MGRILEEVIADLPAESQTRVTVLSEELHAEVKRLDALSKQTQCSQEQGVQR